MTLEEMGALLRQERERQGISLETAATEIKISKKYLVALEEGQTKELPHPVYAKGFVKNYARLLGLDPEEMGAVLSSHYAVDDDQLREPPGQEPREAAPSIRERRPSFASQGTSGFKPSLWLALPLLLVFGGLVWFFFFSSFGQGFSVESVLGLFSSKQEQAAPETQAAQKPAASAPAAPAASASGPKAEAKPEQAAPAQADQSGPVQRDLLATTPGPGGVKQAPAVPAAPAPEQNITPEKLAAEAQFAASGKQVVEINAIQPATVEATTEDGQKRSLTLVKGQRLALRFNDRVVVRFQQAPSVSVKLNGKDYPLEGGRADGKSITFP
ncbi:helix-turn-helix domain-containing protein [Fundidesulfovibrio putealis]|uniref:helix-turn-helix domain-containing protein n=1 Tax=Fundidesulfovibrio putealis TaxID=270496 RepID=UPI0003FB6CEE|nr:helix-turn-helix transcriptional regulator [Fundidesulfovibrio putealis]